MIVTPLRQECRKSATLTFIGKDRFEFSKIATQKWKILATNKPTRGIKMQHFAMSVGCMFGAVVAFSPLSAASAQTESNQAATLSELAHCRSVTNDTIRLSCYDRAVDALVSAERAGEVVVLDRAQMRETNRQLFGFQVANPFANRTNGEPEPEVESIETTLRTASVSGDGKWIFRLTDGSEWRQIDSGEVRFRNREGEAVRVRRASLGSYLMTLNGSRAVRVRRQ